MKAILSAVCGSGPRAAASACAAACGGTVAQVGWRACGEALAVYGCFFGCWLVAFLFLAVVAVAAGQSPKKEDA